MRFSVSGKRRFPERLCRFLTNRWKIILMLSLCLYVLVAYNFLHDGSRTNAGNARKAPVLDRGRLPFEPGVKLEEFNEREDKFPVHRYDEVVDLRIVVLTCKESSSLKVVLKSLQDLELDGHYGMIEIWLDANDEGSYDDATYQVASGFRWKQGPVRLHVQRKHVGNARQYISTWRPRPRDSDNAHVPRDELALYLEEGNEISPFAYRWLRAAHEAYVNRSDICGYSLQDDHVHVATGNRMGLEVLPEENSPVYLYRVPGLLGFAPHPSRWREFQEWYYGVIIQPDFHPYVPVASSYSTQFKESGESQSMWIMWLMRFSEDQGLSTLYSNLPTYAQRSDASLIVDYTDSPRKTSYLLSFWKELTFPKAPTKYGYDGGVL